METAQIILLVLATLIGMINPQKTPPGVPPSTYQHQQPPPPQPGQYQPPPPPPPQYQQQPPPPPQQLPQQQPIQSAVPLDHQQNVPHAHHDHHGQPQLLNTANLAEEREHMQEHLNVNIDTSKMTEQELQFHYFKMHDADNNNKLDGCELIKSLIHWHDDEDNKSAAQENKVYTDEALTENIDPIMEMLDKNSDGYIDWGEYQANHPKD